ncbi:MAG TPA: ankyrin repeat domain-containing protein, partial [Luteolibacter sp.]|nr:ankyrin repeat domain-containing protein [Luteolibacter sp.]
APTSTDPEDAEIARLKEIARNSPDLIDGADADGWRPIHHAAAKGHIRVLSYLLENKADPNSRTIAEKLTPLQLASIHGYLGTVKALLASKADINATFEIKACPEGLLPVADRNMKSAYGDWTALDLAILYDRRETARALIDAGADIKRDGPAMIARSPRREGLANNFTTLELAIFLQRNDLAQALIEAGSPLELTDSKNQTTPLELAVTHNPEMVTPLLKAGADPKSTKHADRITPLHFAAMIDAIKSAKLLLEAGADVNVKDASGKSPLHWVYSPDMVDLLVSKGAEPNAKDSSGFTPLDLVAAGDSGRSNPRVIESLLRNGATVADPRELLRLTSEAMLPFVGERLVYPKVHNPDAILLSVSGYHSFNPEPPPAGRTPRARVAGRSQQESRPEIIALETLASPASPPPSLAEVMRMALSGYPRSIRILRCGENDRIDIIREWTENGDNSLPTDWPDLQWGDIVEVSNSSGGRSGAPTVGDFATMIPARAVTTRLSGLEFPKNIPGEETFWLDYYSYQTLISRLPPNIQRLAYLNRFVVHRKGLPEPVTLDFSKPSDTRFRLLDGDTVDLSWDIAKLDNNFSDDRVIHMTYLRGEGVTGNFPVQNLIGFLSRIPLDPRVDFSKICVLRRAENWKPEMVDLKAWLDHLPPREKWERDALVSSEPKLNPGDAVILIDNPAADAEKTAAEVRNKIVKINTAMIPRRARPPQPVPR